MHACTTDRFALRAADFGDSRLAFQRERHTLYRVGSCSAGPRAQPLVRGRCVRVGPELDSDASWAWWDASKATCTNAATSLGFDLCCASCACKSCPGGRSSAGRAAWPMCTLYAHGSPVSRLAPIMSFWHMFPRQVTGGPIFSTFPSKPKRS